MSKNVTDLANQFDRAVLLQRVEGDQELFAEMIRAFIEDAPRLVQSMREALRHGDLLRLERAAHSMKGAAANLSANALVAASSNLEKSAVAGDLESCAASVSSVEEAANRLLSLLNELCQGVPR
ncbi:MAG: Hpt domain-containing protein [Candidatus Acidiferrales bacterium]